jgi:NhaP-type Na+/H+ or K+/H+ antiporter
MDSENGGLKIYDWVPPNLKKLTMNEVLIVTFSGVRGALGILVCHLLPVWVPHIDRITSITTSVIMMTLFIYVPILLIITNKKILTN